MLKAESKYTRNSRRRWYEAAVPVCCGLLLLMFGQAAFGDDDCEEDVCIDLQLMLGTVTYDVPPQQLEFHVEVPDLPEDQDRITVKVHLTREIGGVDTPIHTKKIKLKKKSGSETASKTAFWDPSESEDKKGKTHRLVVVVELDDEEESSDKTEAFKISWSED